MVDHASTRETKIAKSIPHRVDRPLLIRLSEAASPLLPQPDLSHFEVWHGEELITPVTTWFIEDGFGRRVFQLEDPADVAFLQLSTSINSHESIEPLFSNALDLQPKGFSLVHTQDPSAFEGQPQPLRDRDFVILLASSGIFSA